MGTRRRLAVRCLVHAIVPVALGCGGGRDAGGAQPNQAAPVASVASAGVTAAAPMRWSGHVAAGRTVEVRTVSGSIRVTSAPGDTAAIEARVRSDDGRPPPVVRFSEDEHGVLARVEYADQDGRGCEDRADHGGERSVVDFDVRVPTGVRLVVHSVHGGIDVDGVAGPIEARTVDGGITLKSATAARARTVNGPITASFRATDLESDCELDTVNGPVQVSLPAGANADITASTLNGDVHLAFPVTGSTSPRRVHGTIGRGGRELRLKTVNGTIDVARAS
jgi:hypothetical protein